LLSRPQIFSCSLYCAAPAQVISTRIEKFGVSREDIRMSYFFSPDQNILSRSYFFINLQIFQYEHL
jgi:hypothetical protein